MPPAAIGMQTHRVVPSTHGTASSPVIPAHEPMPVSHVRPRAHAGTLPPEQGVAKVRLNRANAPVEPLLKPATGALERELALRRGMRGDVGIHRVSVGKLRQ